MPKNKSSSHKNTPIAWIFLILCLVLATVHYTYKHSLISTPKNDSATKNETTTQVITWEDVLRCDNEVKANQSKWKTYNNTDNGLHFSYPPTWKFITNSQVFQHGDAVGLTYSTTNNESFPGGGGVKTNGARLYISRPVVSDVATQEEWFDKHIAQAFLLSSNLKVLPNNNLQLGNKTGIGMYFCGEGCITQIYTKVDDKVWGINYILSNDYVTQKKGTFKSELCGILSSLEFQK